MCECWKYCDECGSEKNNEYHDYKYCDECCACVICGRENGSEECKCCTECGEQKYCVNVCKYCGYSRCDPYEPPICKCWCKECYEIEVRGTKNQLCKECLLIKIVWTTEMNFAFHKWKNDLNI